jgi:3-dehydroquinate synthetase
VYFVLPSGESNKSMKNVVKLIHFLSCNNFSRQDLVVGVGGGVVTDFTGLAASLFLRGYLNLMEDF